MSTPSRARARLRRAITTVLGCAVALAVITVPVTPAHAASTTTCTGTSHVALSPGMTLTPQTVTVTENDALTSCTSTDPTLTSGSLGPFVYSVPNASCNSIFPLGTGPLLLAWNNGQTSTATLTYTASSTAGIVQQTGVGSIIAGQFTGAAAVVTWIYLLVNPLECLVPGGMTSQNGTILVQITGL
ncbi:hypothetical protein [Phytomonospora endophytica]|uniref:Secreted protein n=1 Tax=Phytomonospora endophytica TaxID=714109 RepID=A0A841FK87_9ACTN|nr:hypothetical protein [Phytomonospora endophytica]MBB6033972.1 hypothetical protein [Phytomonospora endophytica]GIG64507.1 hypothetical protein Pen01_08020 [Phytomonospora endophytica]